MGKDSIIDKIRASNLEKVDLSKPLLKEDFEGDLAASFTKALQANHVQVVRSESPEKMMEILDESMSSVDNYASSLSEASPSLESMSNLELYITRSGLGVAENGAMWISSRTEHRVLPFIAEHLIVVIREQDLVGDMHEAYKSIVDPEGFGVFIAGPSKTADIEQSLVIGAHGAKEMTVILEIN